MITIRVLTSGNSTVESIIIGCCDNKEEAFKICQAWATENECNYSCWDNFEYYYNDNEICCDLDGNIFYY